MKSAVIAVMALLIIFLADRMVRLENQHYALRVGTCKQTDPANSKPFWDCLEHVQTRTSWFAHFLYAATDHVPALSHQPLCEQCGLRLINAARQP
jgi:hypothetical protein